MVRDHGRQCNVSQGNVFCIMSSNIMVVQKLYFAFGFNAITDIPVGPGVAWWLRCCATSRTVPGSIPGCVTGFFSGIFPSDCIMALGSTQPLVKMSTRNVPGVKAARCVRLTSPPSRAECHEILEPKPPGTLWATPGLLHDSKKKKLIYQWSYVHEMWYDSTS